MLGALPTRINPFRRAELGACVEGAIPLARMPRLAEVLAAPQGQARVLLRFAREVDGLNVVVGQVHAVLELQCQRCLQPVTKTIDRPFKLAVVRNDAEAKRVQADYETLQVNDEAVFIRDLVEDELLLSLPMVPVHDQSANCDTCMLEQLNGDQSGPAGDKQPTSNNPFAVLQTLKRS
jgi:uncharacterized protein